MPFLIENVLRTVVLLITLGSVGLAIFVIAAVQRRVRREQFFRGLDGARIRAKHRFELLHTDEGVLQERIKDLKKFREDAELQALEEVFLDRARPGANLAVIRKVSEEMGWLQEWIRVLRYPRWHKAGRVAEMLRDMGDTYHQPGRWQRLQMAWKCTFLDRCMAAKRLSQVPTPEGVIALLAGTNDPHHEVREVCVSKLGQLGDPATLPVLIEELIQVLEGKSPLSVRILKAALVRFDLDDMDAFRPALVHPNRRVRFFATDIIREVAQVKAKREQLSKNDFSPEVYRLFIGPLWQDEWADVRARAAPVIVHFNDSTSTDIITRLLDDPTWFVRLHTCRAVNNRLYLGLVPAIAKRLSDQNWFVREAAVRSLGLMGDVGVNETFNTFLTTRDAFAVEQIAEALQREGTLVDMLSGLTMISSDLDYQRARSVIRRMAQIGKTTLMQSYLVAPVPKKLKLMLIEELNDFVSAGYLQALQSCLEVEEDMDVREAAALALRLAGV